MAPWLIRIEISRKGLGREILDLGDLHKALTYGVPPFVRLKPRPEGNLYATAAALSMRGDHQAMVAVFADMLDRHLDTG